MGTPSQTAGRPTDVGDLLVPITLELSTIRQLLIVDVADDPTYRTLEPQVLEGPGGDGLVLLAYRHDGHVELYAPPGLDVDPSGYDGLGAGLLGIQHASFERARFEVAEGGLLLELAFEVPDGRRFDLRIHEHLAGGRDRIPVLAPVGGSFDAPAFFPFLWLPGLSFVPVRGTEVEVRIDGQVRSVPRLPLPVGGRRCLMARYDPDVLVCQVNPDSVGEATRVPRRTSSGTGGTGVDVVEVADGFGVAAVRVARGDHTCAVLLDPPLPEPRTMPQATTRSGAFLLQADDSTELRGRYELTRTEGRVDIVIEGLGPWRTRTRRPLLALLFRLPLFRRWPTTYRWRATLDVDPASEGRLTSTWERRTGR
jgi:hypothetical protein